MAGHESLVVIILLFFISFQCQRGSAGIMFLFLIPLRLLKRVVQLITFDVRLTRDSLITSLLGPVCLRRIIVLGLSLRLAGSLLQHGVWTVENMAPSSSMHQST